MRFSRCPATARWVLLPALTVWLGACHLIDQESFGNAPRPPAPDMLEAALHSNGAAPLITINPDDGTDYGAALNAAIESARDKQGITHFHVLAIAAPGQSLAGTAQALRQASSQAESVIDAMSQDGVAPERITLSAATKPGVNAVSIEVFAEK